MLTIYDFKDLLTDSDAPVQIFDNGTGEVIFDGTFDELPEELEDEEIMSIDAYMVDNKFVLNIR